MKVLRCVSTVFVFALVGSEVSANTQGYRTRVQGTVTSFSRDAARIVAIRNYLHTDGFVDVISRKDARESKAIPVTGYAKRASISGSGAVLAVASEGRVIDVWNANSGNRLNRLAINSDWNSTIAISADDRLIAANDEDKTLGIWNVATGKRITSLNGHNSRIVATAFSTDGRHVASSDESGEIIVWNLQLKRLAQRLHRHTRAVTSLAFTSDSKLLASASSDRSVYLWDWQTSKEPQTAFRSESELTVLTFSPTDRLLAAGDTAGQISIWSVDGTKHRNYKVTDNLPITAICLFGASPEVAVGTHREFAVVGGGP